VYVLVETIVIVRESVQVDVESVSEPEPDSVSTSEIGREVMVVERSSVAEPLMVGKGGPEGVVTVLFG
jgi:hypothetical protein